MYEVSEAFHEQYADIERMEWNETEDITDEFKILGCGKRDQRTGRL